MSIRVERSKRKFRLRRGSHATLRWQWKVIVPGEVAGFPYLPVVYHLNTWEQAIELALFLARKEA